MNPPFIFFLILPSKSFASGPLLRNDNLGGKFQKGDLIFDTEIFLFMNSLAKYVFLTRHKLC